MIKNIIFDLDNTLCNCSIFYRQKQMEFAQYQSSRTNHSVEFCLDLLKKIDVTFTSTPEGFSKTRFPRAFAAASITIDIMMGNPIDESAAQHSWFIGDSVFNEPYPLFDGVFDVLTHCKNNGYNMFLLTKGDYEVQMKKVVNNGLDNIFDSDKIYIFPHKTSTEFSILLNDHQLEINETIVVGDSIRDDIGSALELGLTTVLVEDATGTWDYENQKHTPHHRIPKVTELPLLLCHFI